MQCKSLAIATQQFLPDARCFAGLDCVAQAQQTEMCDTSRELRGSCAQPALTASDPALNVRNNKFKILTPLIK
jgi:hypothetical protein